MPKDNNPDDTKGTENNRRSVKSMIADLNAKAGDPLLPGIKSKKQIEASSADKNIKNSSKSPSIVNAKQNNDADEKENIRPSVKELASRIEAKTSTNKAKNIGRPSVLLNDHIEEPASDQNIQQLEELTPNDTLQYNQYNNDTQKPTILTTENYNQQDGNNNEDGSINHLTESTINDNSQHVQDNDAKMLTNITTKNYTQHDEKKKPNEDTQSLENPRKNRKTARRPAADLKNEVNKETLNPNDIDASVHNTRKRAHSNVLKHIDDRNDKYLGSEPLTDIFVLENKDPEIKHIRKLFIGLCEKFNKKYEQKLNSIFIVDKEKKSYISDTALSLLIDNKLDEDIILHGVSLKKGTRLLKVFVIEIEAFANSPSSFIQNDRKDERIEEIKGIALKLDTLHPAENESKSYSGPESATPVKSSNKRSPKGKSLQ